MLATLVNKMPGLFAYVDAGLRYRFANETYRTWRGMDPAEIVGRGFREVVGEENYDYLAAKAERALGGEAVSYEHELFDGPLRRYVHGSYTPDVQSDGSVAGFVILVTDISDRHHLEEQLRRSERQFNDAFHSSAIGMAIVAPSGAWLDVNGALVRMLGYGAEELKSLSFQDLTHPDDLDTDLELFADLLAGRLPSYQLEKRYCRKDGALVHAILSVSIVRDADGNPLHFVSQMQDITARRQAEERLFQEHELSQITLRSIGDGVITSDVEGRVSWMNPVAERLTGWSTGEAQGRQMAEIFRVVDERGQTIPDPLLRAIEADRVIELEKDAILLSATGGAVPVADSAAPIRNSAGVIVGGILVFQDVSDDRRLQRELRARAETDPLTGLPNRAGFNQNLERTLQEAGRDGRQIALLFCDLDGFKPVNDRFGHARGDWVLQEVARRLSETIRGGDIVSRWAGDEFGIIVRNVAPDALDQVAERLIAAISDPFHPPGMTEAVNIGLSVGIAVGTGDTDMENLLLSADKGLYAAKAAGGRVARWAEPAALTTAS